MKLATSDATAGDDKLLAKMMLDDACRRMRRLLAQGAAKALIAQELALIARAGRRYAGDAKPFVSLDGDEP